MSDGKPTPERSTPKTWDELAAISKPWAARARQIVEETGLPDTLAVTVAVAMTLKHLDAGTFIKGS